MPAVDELNVELPDVNADPPLAAAYQSTVLPLGGVALIVPGAALAHIVTVPPPVGAAGFGLMIS